MVDRVGTLSVTSDLKANQFTLLRRCLQENVFLVVRASRPFLASPKILQALFGMSSQGVIK